MGTFATAAVMAGASSLLVDHHLRVADVGAVTQLIVDDTGWRSPRSPPHHGDPLDGDASRRDHRDERRDDDEHAHRRDPPRRRRPDECPRDAVGPAHDAGGLGAAGLPRRVSRHVGSGPW